MNSQKEISFGLRSMLKKVPRTLSRENNAELNNFHTNLSVSQRICTFTNHKTYIHPPPTKDFLQHPPSHRPYITTPSRIMKSWNSHQKSHITVQMHKIAYANLIRMSRTKIVHKISQGHLIRPKSVKSPMQQKTPKRIKSHEEISRRPQKSMKIPLGNVMRKVCSTKHEVAWEIGKKRRQKSFTGNTRKEGGRTLIKIAWPTMKANSNFMHNQLLAQHIFPISLSLSPETSHACLCITS